MSFSTTHLAVLALAGSAAAQHGGLQHSHNARRAVKARQAPIYGISANSSAVYGSTGRFSATSASAQATSGYTSTSTFFETTTEYVTVHPSSAAAANAGGQYGGVVAHKAAMGGVFDGPGSSGTCPVVTVTDVTTYTVTSGGIGAGAASSSAFNPDLGANTDIKPVSSPMVADNNAAAMTSASTSALSSSASQVSLGAIGAQKAAMGRHHSQPGQYPPLVSPPSSQSAAPMTTSATAAASVSHAASIPASTSQQAGSLTAYSSAAPPATTAGPSNCKRDNAISFGCAYDDYANCQALSAAGVKLDWSYNWHPYKNKDDNANFVPMLRGLGSSDLADWAAASAMAATATYIMGPNEPMITGQACGATTCQPSSVASVWKTSIAPHAAHATLISPAISGGDGLPYLQELSKQGVVWNVINYHFYASCDGSTPGQDQRLLSELKGLNGAYPNMPIWITEINCDNFGSKNTANFMQWALEQAPTYGVERFAWFMAAKGNGYLLSSSGGLSGDVGAAYKNATLSGCS